MQSARVEDVRGGGRGCARHELAGAGGGHVEGDLEVGALEHVAEQRVEGGGLATGCSCG